MGKIILLLRANHCEDQVKTTLNNAYKVHSVKCTKVLRYKVLLNNFHCFLHNTWREIKDNPFAVLMFFLNETVNFQILDCGR